jgi:hypothetical protein
MRLDRSNALSGAGLRLAATRKRAVASTATPADWLRRSCVNGSWLRPPP